VRTQKSEIKGTAVLSIQKFVKNTFPDRYEEWLTQLTHESAQIIGNPIFANAWYPMYEAGVLPTIGIKMFYNNDYVKAAWESGRYSAETGLKGVYRIFVKASDPGFIINRASKIFETFYRPANLCVSERFSKGITLQITDLDDSTNVIVNRIAGWSERALEINGCKNLKIEVVDKKTEDTNLVEMPIKWD